MLVHGGHGFGFWQILANEAVGVFVGASFPRVMRGGEVKFDSGLLLNGFVAMELRAIVSSDRLDALSMTLDNLEQPGVELVDSSRLELAYEGVSGLSFNQGEDAIPAPLAEHGVDLPVSEGLPGFNVLWALRDVALSCQSAPAVIGTITLSALLEGTAKVGIKVTAGFPVGPDVQIDSFVTDIYEVLPLQIAGDLLGAPIEPKERLNNGKILGRELPIPSRAAPASSCPTVSLERTVTTISASVSPCLSVDRATVATEDGSDL